MAKNNLFLELDGSPLNFLYALQKLAEENTSLTKHPAVSKQKKLKKIVIRKILKNQTYRQR